MTRITTSRACSWNEPRPYTDPSLRLKHNGPIQPMQYEGVNVRREIIGGGLLLIAGLTIAVLLCVAFIPGAN